MYCSISAAKTVISHASPALMAALMPKPVAAVKPLTWLKLCCSRCRRLPQVAACAAA